jgi:hypothetical protein
MWGRRSNQPVRTARLDTAQMTAVVATSAATADQDDAADYHDGTPFGSRAWWQDLDDADDDEDVDEL